MKLQREIVSFQNLLDFEGILKRTVAATANESKELNCLTKKSAVSLDVYQK